MVNLHNMSKRIRFGGLICFWAIPHTPDESSRQRFFRTYESLRSTVEQTTLAAQSRKPWWKWALVRINQPGRWFLGIARH